MSSHLPELKQNVWLASSSLTIGILSVLQNLVLLKLLGSSSWGLIISTIAVAHTVQTLLSFKVTGMLLRFAPDLRSNGSEAQGRELIKLAFTIEALFASIASILLFLCARPFAALFLQTKDNYSLLTIGALIPLVSIFYETGFGILRARGAFGAVALSLIEDAISVKVFYNTWSHFVKT